MIVISLKSNTKLIKGHEYIANSFDNTNSMNWYSGYISIKGFGRYKCEDFTDTSGNPLPQINYTNPSNTIQQFNVRNLKVGDIIVCNTNKYKYLVKEGKYKISHINFKTQYTTKIKLQGYNTWLNWSNGYFRKLSLQESRDIAISQIFDQPENFNVEFIRKFDKEKNKTKILLETIAKSIIDPYRHHLDIIEWGIHKEKYQQLTREDFSEMLQKPLGEILELYENSIKNN